MSELDVATTAPTPLTSLDPGIAAALHELVAEGTLSEAQADRTAVLLATRTQVTQAGATSSPSQSGAQAHSDRGGRLLEVASYAGGALLLGAAALSTGVAWGNLSRASGCVFLAGLTALLLLGGRFMASSSGQTVRELGQQHDSARRRLVSLLWTLGAASAAASTGLAIDSPNASPAPSAVGLLVLVITYRLVPGLLGQLCMWVASIALVSGLVHEIGVDPDTTAYAVALVALGGAWVAMGIKGTVRGREVALATGAALALVSAQLPLFSEYQWPAYLLTAGVALAGFMGYISTRSWAVLTVGVLATTLVVPEALHDWTDGSVSAAGSMLVAGLTLLTAAAAGLRLRQEVS